MSIILNTGEYEGLAYLVIPHDSASQQFSLREEVTVLPNPALQIDSYAQGVLVKDNFFYQVSLRHNTFRTGGNQDLVLSTYDLSICCLNTIRKVLNIAGRLAAVSAQTVPLYETVFFMFLFPQRVFSKYRMRCILKRLKCGILFRMW